MDAVLVTTTTLHIKTYTPEEVREKLDEHGLSVNHFAELVGVTRASMSRVLAAKHTPSRLLRIRMAEVLEQLDREASANSPASNTPRLRHRRSE